MITSLFTRRMPVALGLAILSSAVSVRAVTRVWNNSTDAWETDSAWTPLGVPTSADIASFDPTVNPTDFLVREPTINSPSDVAAALNLNNNFLGGTYTFTDSGTLTLSGPIKVRGVGTQTFDGPILAGAAAGNLSFNVGTSSGLTLSGATTATTNAGTASLFGGTLTLDNVANNTLRLGTSTGVSFVGGILSILGNNAGTAYSLGAASFNAGFNTVSVTSNGGSGTSVNFANGTVGNGVSLRTQTYMVERFEAPNGVLGSANGPRVTFTGTPFLGANGLLANSAPTATSGGIVAAAPTVTAATAAQLQAATATDRVQFNPAAASTNTATGTITNGSLRITAAGAGATLAMGTNALATNGVRNGSGSPQWGQLQNIALPTRWF